MKFVLLILFGCLFSIQISLWVNGAVTCQFDGCEAENGHLGFAGEGYRVEFRNVKVKELN